MLKQRKILIASGIYPPDIGGPATYVFKLEQELKKQGFSVKVLAYTKLRCLPKGIRHFVFLIKIFFIASRVNVIYAQNPISAGFPAALASRFWRKKMILKVVGDGAWEKARNRELIDTDLKSFQCLEVGPLNIGLKIKLLKRIQKFTAQTAQTIITPSLFLKKIVGLWGVEQGKIKVVHNAIELPTQMAASKEQAQQKIGIAGDIILSIGRLSPWKGFTALIEAMPGLLKINNNFKLVIVGDGEEKLNLQAKILKLGLEGKVLLTGRVAHNRIPLYLKASQMFVLNSQYEGLPHVVLEAMTAELPVIASRAGGNPEVIQDSVNGLLIDYNDQEQIKVAILKLWGDKQLSQKFIANSKTKLQQFSFNQMLSQTISILEN